MKPEIWGIVLGILHMAYSENGVCIVKMVDGKLKKVGQGCKDTSSLSEKFDAILEFVPLSNGLSYKLFRVRKNYEDARRECEKYGARLVSAGLRDATVKNDIWKLIKSANSKVWIGLTDQKKEGVWVWDDGTVMDNTYSEWSAGQPDNYRGEQHCAYYSTTYRRVDDYSCAETLTFVCERWNEI